MSEEEWLVFRQFYSLDGPPLRASWFGETEGWRSQPGLCGECFADLASEREQYRDATIHIRKVEAPGKEEEGEREEEAAEPEVSHQFFFALSEVGFGNKYLFFSLLHFKSCNQALLLACLCLS